MAWEGHRHLVVYFAASKIANVSFPIFVYRCSLLEVAKD